MWSTQPELGNDCYLGPGRHTTAGREEKNLYYSHIFREKAAALGRTN